MKKTELLASSLRDGTFDVKTYLQVKDQETPSYFAENQANAPIETFGASVIDYALGIMGTIGMILLIVAGFRLMMARGDSGKIDEAKEMIKLVLFGLMLAFMAYIAVIGIQALFSG